ncbi:hypothetical protein [Pseudonocardia pini]|uniref:hypothetical protein n=1 Tax=Pseudonocardia pini TaxID=2758030 RepID=UPI0015F115F3|nr:hypothetical protein [Pseudonocardia pini]
MSASTRAQHRRDLVEGVEQEQPGALLDAAVELVLEELVDGGSVIPDSRWSFSSVDSPAGSASTHQ